MRTPACIATYGGLLALWQLAGAEWMLAAKDITRITNAIWKPGAKRKG